MLQNMDIWDYAFLGIAVVISIYTLVTLMNKYRDRLVEHLREEVEAGAKAKEQEKKQ